MVPHNTTGTVDSNYSYIHAMRTGNIIFLEISLHYYYAKASTEYTIESSLDLSPLFEDGEKVISWFYTLQGVTRSSDSVVILPTSIITDWNDLTQQITSTSSAQGTYVHQTVKIGFVGKV